MIRKDNSPVKKLLKQLMILLFLLAAVSCNKEPQWQTLPLPNLAEETLHLRVANVVNPRFPELSDEQLQQLLDKTVLMVKQHFNLSIAFDKAKPVSIQKLFETLPAHVIKEKQSDIVKFGTVSNTDILKMRDSVYKVLKNYEGDRQAIFDYASPYLLSPVKGNDFHQLSAALVETLLKRLKYWQTQKADDGQPVIDDHPYNEWVWWDSLGYGQVPYDVVITNQLVASAEMYDLSVHSSIRGGITAGTTMYSKQARYGSYVYIMVYPMLNDSDMLVELRNDETYSSEQATTYAAALLTHEIGHQLLHLGHPFGNSNCIMSPTPLLKYREWVDGLDASQCQLNSEPSMTPGFVNIEYRADW